jgi:hypothetical protein
MRHDGNCTVYMCFFYASSVIIAEQDTGNETSRTQMHYESE